MNYQNSGTVSQTKISEPGRHFGAQYVFIVDHNYVLNELYASSRIINVENNTVEAASDESEYVSTMDQLRDLSNRISASTLAQLPYNIDKKQQAEKDKFLKEQQIFKNQFTTQSLYNYGQIYTCYRDYANLSKETAQRYIQACKDLGIAIEYPVYYATELLKTGNPYKVGKSGKYQSVQIKAYRIYESGDFGYEIWNIQLDLRWSKTPASIHGKIRGCFLHR